MVEQVITGRCHYCGECYEGLTQHERECTYRPPEPKVKIGLPTKLYWQYFSLVFTACLMAICWMKVLTIAALYIGNWWFGYVPLPPQCVVQ